MGLTDILLLLILMLTLRQIPWRGFRLYGLMGCSALFLFRLQGLLPIREADYWLPALSLGIVALTFCAVRGSAAFQRENLVHLIFLCAVMLLIPLTRSLSYDGIFTASRPPRAERAALFILVIVLLCGFCARFRGGALTALTVGLILVLVILKCEPLSLAASRVLRGMNGQDKSLSTAFDLRWLGVSYLFFRLLSTLIDSRKGRSFDFTFGEYLIYACFPPALTAGPIDRAERFTKDLRTAPKRELVADFRDGGTRLAQGIAKKFIVADLLALTALSPANAGQFVHRGSAWLALVAYGLQLYFDFSGCTDIAIGLGLLLGIKLPENFDRPYLKGDITKFWSCWHMTLTQWIRAYVFNPLTRVLRAKRERPIPAGLVVFIPQMATMLIIGLWHGISLNFILWGLWHGLGLFVHRQYTEISGKRLRRLEKERPALSRCYGIGATLLSDLYVMLGWVWFVLPDVHSALLFFGRLFLKIS